MMLTRRQALLGGISFSLAAGLRSPLRAATASLPSPLTVVATGIDLNTTPERLEAFARPFLDAGVPLTVCVAPTSGSGSRLEPKSALAQLLRSLIDAHPGLFEAGIDGGELPDDPYFQLREASDAQTALTWALNPLGDFRQQPLYMSSTLATTTPSAAIDHLSGLRAGGIRTVVHLPQPGAPKAQAIGRGYWTTPTGLAKTFAAPATAVALPALRTAQQVLAGIKAEAASREAINVHLPLEALAALDGADLERFAADLAAAIASAAKAELIRPILPATLYAQSAGGPVRHVIVRVDDLRVALGTEHAHRAFTIGLLKAGIPVTEGVIPLGYGPTVRQPLSADSDAKTYLESASFSANYDIATHGLQHTYNELLGRSLDEDNHIVSKGIAEIYGVLGKAPRTYVPPEDVFDENAVVAMAACGVPMLSAEPRDYQHLWGLNRFGILELSNSVKFEKSWVDDVPYYTADEVLRFIGPHNDAVLMIHPATASTPEKLGVIADVLARLAAEPQTKLVNFAQYYDAAAPKMPLVEVLREARSQRQVADAVQAGIRPDDLKQDADVAWRYFDEMAASNNGLVLGTSWNIGGKREGYAFLTMWDMASLIMAHCSAFRIGLIGQPRLEQAATGILKTLATSSFSFRGVSLPQTERPIGKAGGQRQGFDVIDTGRLLIALKRLDEMTGKTLGIDALVKQWGFAAVLGDGELKNVGPKGSLIAVGDSSYALYATRGFALWDIPLNFPFKAKHPAKDMDATQTFFAELAARGAIATEPWATELVELPPSEHANVVADLLYGAQMRRHAQTGYLTSVSEAAIDHDPWFIYQGYQINAAGGDWRVDTDNAHAGHTGADFADANRLVSTKGSFLWAAIRPGAYASALHALVREKCATDTLGFTTGVYESTGVASRLSDVNTNGIVLEAIDYMLADRKPLLSPG